MFLKLTLKCSKLRSVKPLTLSKTSQSRPKRKLKRNGKLTFSSKNLSWIRNSRILPKRMLKKLKLMTSSGKISTIK